MVEYSWEGPKRDFPINTLGSRLPFGCRGRTWCQLYGGRWRMPGSILCYRQFSAATEPALGPVSTMSRPRWGNQNNRRGSDPSFVSGRKRQEQSPLLWWFRVTGWWQPHVSSLGSGRATGESLGVRLVVHHAQVGTCGRTLHNSWTWQLSWSPHPVSSPQLPAKGGPSTG